MHLLNVGFVCCVKTVYLARIRHVIIVMINDGGLLLVKLNAALTAQLPQRVTCVTLNNRKNKWQHYSKLK